MQHSPDKYFIFSINTIENQCARSVKTIKYRPLSALGFSRMQKWLLDYDWKQVYEAKTADDKAEEFQNVLVNNVETFFPTKTRLIIISTAVAIIRLKMKQKRQLEEITGLLRCTFA